MNFLRLLAVSGALALPLLLWPSLTETLASPTMLMILLLVFSFPHFVSSYFLFYEEKSLRNQHPLIAWVMPTLLGLALLTCGLWSEQGAFVLLQAAYLLLHWHFAKQAFGVSLWLQKKDSFPKAYRELCLAACLAIALQGFLESQSSPTVLNVFKSQMNSLSWRPELIQAGRGLMILLVSAFLLYSGLQLLKHFSWKRVLALFPVLSLLLWFQYRSFPGSYLLLIPVLHGLQYLPFSLRSLRGSSPLTKTTILKVLSVWALAGFLFWALPRLLGAQSFPYLTGAGILFVFLNVHHFFVDTVLWKSRHSSLIREGF